MGFFLKKIFKRFFEILAHKLKQTHVLLFIVFGVGNLSIGRSYFGNLIARVILIYLVIYIRDYIE